MRIQVLVATMHQVDHSLLEKMNIQTDAIVGNQCDRNEVEEFEWDGHKIKYLSFAERGVGLNRNNSLMRADADVCIFADDDVVYYDGYAEKIEKAFTERPDADVIIFNFKSPARNGGELRDKVRQSRRVGKRGVTAYGAPLIAFRTQSIKYNNIVFHRMFGGGAEFSCGEDTIFLQDCVNKGLRVYTDTTTLGVINSGESTWFKGYTDKYFIDKGILYRCVFGRMAKPYAVYHVIKHKRLYADVGVKRAISLMLSGVNKRF